MSELLDKKQFHYLFSTSACLRVSGQTDVKLKFKVAYEYRPLTVPQKPLCISCVKKNQLRSYSVITQNFHIMSFNLMAIISLTICSFGSFLENPVE